MEGVGSERVLQGNICQPDEGSDSERNILLLLLNFQGHSLAEPAKGE